MVAPSRLRKSPLKPASTIANRVPFPPLTEPKDPKKRVVIANPDEPRTGDYMYGLYDRTHPVYGDKDEIARMRKALRGLRGQQVTLTFKGEHITAGGTHKKFRIRRTFQLNTYRDVFGPGSAYASAVKFIRDKYSEDVLVTNSIDIEESEYDDEDSEDE